MSVTEQFSITSKRENSTLIPTFRDSAECTFKNGCSMLNPTLLLELHDSQFPNYTAFKIGNRYYHVTNINSVRNNIFEISGKVDSLATYKAQILASTQYVSYSSVSGGTWLADTRIPVLKNANVKATSVNLNALSKENGSFIVSVVGKSGCKTYGLTSINLADLIGAISDWETDGIDAASQIIQTSDDVGEVLASVGEALINSGFIGNAYANAPQCIRSCIYVPFNDIRYDGSEIIWLGNFNTHVQARVVSPKPTTFLNDTVISIPWHFSDWRRTVCEEVYLYLPLVGMVQVPSDEIVNQASFAIEASLAATDGTVAYKVKSGSQVIGTYGANCAINYPIGINQQASAGDIMTTAIQGIEKTVSSGVRAATSVTPSGIAGNAVDAVFSGINTAYDTVNTALSSHISTIGNIGGGAGLGLGTSITCFTVSHPTVIEPAAMRQTMGVPTMKPLQLSSCSGFCQCANAHVDISGTSSERDAIDYYLNSGFYIE